MAGDNPRWVDDAKCRWGTAQSPGPSFFYPTDGPGASRTIAYCRGWSDGVECPTRMDCLELAIVNNEVFGVWGGVGQRDRVRIRNRWKETGVVRDLSEQATIVTPPRLRTKTTKAEK